MFLSHCHSWQPYAHPWCWGCPHANLLCQFSRSSPEGEVEVLGGQRDSESPRSLLMHFCPSLASHTTARTSSTYPDGSAINTASPSTHCWLQVNCNSFQSSPSQLPLTWKKGWAKWSVSEMGPLPGDRARGLHPLFPQGTSSHDTWDRITCPAPLCQSGERQYHWKTSSLPSVLPPQVLSQGTLGCQASGILQRLPLLCTSKRLRCVVCPCHQWWMWRNRHLGTGGKRYSQPMGALGQLTNTCTLELPHFPWHQWHLNSWLASSWGPTSRLINMLLPAPIACAVGGWYWPAAPALFQLCSLLHTQIIIGLALKLTWSTLMVGLCQTGAQCLGIWSPAPLHAQTHVS